MDDNQTSNEIRADIDQTRAAVGDKIDQLQARLDPNRLKEQATETVQEMLSDTANSMTEYVRTHKDEMVASVADAARRNPVPTALVGLGLGWLILESMAGNRGDDRDYARGDEYSRRGSRRSFEGSTGRSFVSSGRGQYREEDYYSPAYYDEPNYGRAGYPAAASAGYSSEAQYASGHYAPGNGHQHGENPIAKAADTVKDKASEIGNEIKDRVQDAGQEVKERVENMGQAVQDRVRDAANETRHQAGQMGDVSQRHLEEGYDRAGQQMQEWRARARYEGRRRGRQLARNLEENPLTYGAVALAVGAALALLLPQTRTENRAFGETRDELMARGQEAWESTKHHAQEVVEEVRPELEQKVREIAHEVKETGKQAAQEAAEELRPVMDKAVAKGKEEARSAAQAAGIDPAMLEGNKPALTRDTLQGQWQQVKGEVKRQWGKLTDDDMTRVEGDFEKLVGSIQTRYGYTRTRAEQEVNDFFQRHSTSASPT